MDFKASDHFDGDKIQEIIKDALEEGMGKSYPNPKRLKIWSTDIGEECLEKIALMKSPLKYLVFTDVMEDNGAGYHFYLSAMWDPERDNYYSFQERRRDQRVWLAVNVIGVAL